MEKIWERERERERALVAYKWIMLCDTGMFRFMLDYEGWYGFIPEHNFIYLVFLSSFLAPSLLAKEACKYQ